MHDATIQRACEGGMLDRAHQLGSENEDDVRIAKRRGAFFCVLADFGELSPKFRGGDG